MIGRRDALLILCALSVPPRLLGQTKLARIGLLLSETTEAHAPRLSSLRSGLSDHGYIEGKNYDFLIRSAEGKYDRLPTLAAELAKLEVDVVVAFGSKAAIAAQRVTTTIPIVVPLIGDPVALGLAKSLSRPTGNLTGHSVLTAQIGAKQVELMREAVPGIRRIAHLKNPANDTQGTSKAIEAACERLKIEFGVVKVGGVADFPQAFNTLAQKRVDAVSFSGDTLFRVHMRELSGLALKHRMASCGMPEYADSGCLLGYGAVDAEMYRQSAKFVDRILKGARPANLPIAQPTKFELAINMKTARALRIDPPRTLLVRADRVIE